MKKTTHPPKAKKKPAPKHQRQVDLPVEDSAVEVPLTDEPDLATDQVAVAARQDEASSAGHRIEPVVEDDEHNAEKLIEEGLHGYLRASPNHPHRAK